MVSRSIEDETELIHRRRDKEVLMSINEDDYLVEERLDQ